MSSAGLGPYPYDDEDDYRFWHREPPWWRRLFWAIFGRPS